MMTTVLFASLQRPFVQAALFLLLTIVCLFIIRPKNVDHAWEIAGMIFIGFMLLNSLLICMAPKYWNYFFYSLGFAVLYLLIIAILVPAITKALKLEGSGESAMVFIAIIYHPVLLLLVLFLKWAYLKIF